MSGSREQADEQPPHPPSPMLPALEQPFPNLSPRKLVDYLPKRPKLEMPFAFSLPLSTSNDLLSVGELSSRSLKTLLYPV